MQFIIIPTFPSHLEVDFCMMIMGRKHTLTRYAAMEWNHIGLVHPCRLRAAYSSATLWDLRACAQDASGGSSRQMNLQSLELLDARADCYYNSKPTAAGQNRKDKVLKLALVKLQRRQHNHQPAASKACIA